MCEWKQATLLHVMLVRWRWGYTGWSRLAGARPLARRRRASGCLCRHWAKREEGQTRLEERKAKLDWREI